MPNACKTGVDKAGGVIAPNGGVGFRVNGKDIAVVGDVVADHAPQVDGGPTGPQNTPHDSHMPKMSTGSGSFKVNGKSVCRTNDFSSCGHKATGTSNFSIT